MPEETLEKISKERIQFLGYSEKNQRPIYLIKRTRSIADLETSISGWIYSPLRRDSCTRIQLCERDVVKVLPLAFEENRIKYDNEVEAYRRLRTCPFVPEFRSSGTRGNLAWMRIERLRGPFLNRLYIDHPGRVFVDEDDRIRLMAQVLEVLREMLSLGLHWNDLSAHNIAISEGRVKVFDFGETGPLELHDHIAMLIWMMHDVQLERAASYTMGIYEKIHSAGRDRAKSRGLRFRPAADFFPER